MRWLQSFSYQGAFNAASDMRPNSVPGLAQRDPDISTRRNVSRPE
jgi:hypothetical protein